MTDDRWDGAEDGPRAVNDKPPAEEIPETEQIRIQTPPPAAAAPDVPPQPTVPATPVFEPTAPMTPTFEPTVPTVPTEPSVPTVPTALPSPPPPSYPTPPYPAASDAPAAPAAPAALTAPFAAFAPFAQSGSDAPPGPAEAAAPSGPGVPGDRWRAAAVGVLNLSGLGLGYVLMRRWLPAVVCWIATGILLLVALPADPSGVPGALLVLYLIFLVCAALHGAYRGLHTRLTWPERSPLAAVLALVLLIVPVGGAVLYNQAHDNAVQQMLLGELHQADAVIAGTNGETFSMSQPDYDTAMTTYATLLDHDRSSQAGQLVLGRLQAFYQSVADPYTQHEYCDAITPLTYLRSLTGKFGAANLGSLATWADAPLATSLYQCGSAALGNGSGSTADDDLNELMSTFPSSSQSGQVEPAVAAAVGKADDGIRGSNPCSATSTLKTLSTQASSLDSSAAGVSAALQKDSSTATADVEAGTFACGVSQYKSGDFTDADTTMNDFTTTYPNDPNKALASDYSIAAQIAEQEPAAGKVIPTTAAGGSISVTILNDSPDTMQILYTGPETGTVDIGACSSCTTYSSNADGQANACTNSSINYPQATINVSPGTTYFLQQNSNSAATANATSEQYEARNDYTDCTFETSILGSL